MSHDVVETRARLVIRAFWDQVEARLSATAG